MRTVFIASAVSVFCGGIVLLAQVPASNAAHDTAGVATANPKLITRFDWSKPKVKSHRDFVKNLTIESFGYGAAPQGEGFEFSPAYTSAFFNLHRLECPRCVIGPVNRTKFTLPPFGATGTLQFADDRIELFSGAGALEAWKPNNTFEPRGLSMGTSTYGDAWLSQLEEGARFAVDGKRRLWLGGARRSLYKVGSGFKAGAEKSQWNTFSAGATFTFGR